MKSLHSPLPLALKTRGVSRREFVKFCNLMVATLALPPRYVSAVGKALSQTTRPVLVWLEFQDCAGNSESMLRTSNPSVAEFVLELLSWEYHELIMAGAGKQAEEALERVVREHKGEYIAVVEGAIPTADGGVYCTIGWKDGARNREACVHEFGSEYRCWRLRLGWGFGSRESKSNGSRRVAGGCPRSESDQSGRLSAQSGEYGSGADSLSDLPRYAGAGPI